MTTVAIEANGFSARILKKACIANPACCVFPVSAEVAAIYNHVDAATALSQYCFNFCIMIYSPVSVFTLFNQNHCSFAAVL